MSGISLEQNSSFIFLGFVLVITVVFVWFGLAPNTATIEVESVSDIVDVLLGLFLAALFLERAQEVFISALRERDRQPIESDLAEKRAELAKQPDDTGLMRAVMGAESTLAEYKVKTRKYAYRFGIVAGLAISIAGVRSLSLIASYENLVGFQASLFHLVDIALTAGVIAGGSEPIHRMVSIVSDTFDAARANVRSNKP